MNELSNEAARALYAQFAGKMAPLTYYYKFRFHFTIETEAARISLSVGGSSDEIYRFELHEPEIKVPATLEEALEDGFSVVLKDKDNDAESFFRPTH